MKTLMLTTHMNTGGITSYIMTLSSGLVKAGCDVAIVSAGGHKILEMKESGVECYDMDIRTKSELSPKIYKALIKLVSFIKEHNIEIIHSHTRVTQVLGHLLSKISGIPYVATCHGFYTPRLSRKLFPCWGENVVAISPAVKDHLMQDFGVPAEKIYLIKHGIPVEEFSVADRETRLKCRQEHHISGHPVIGIIARLADVKGHEVLIRAYQKILRQYPESKLVIVGEGKHEPVLRRLVSELELVEHVIFHPVIGKTMELLPAFDIFAMPSLSEGFGLSMIEAMAAGLPVVASRVGGIPSFIYHNETGLLVNPKDHDGLADAILDILDHPQKAREIGVRARQLIEDDYSADQMVKRTVELYKKTYEEHSRR